MYKYRYVKKLPITITIPILPSLTIICGLFLLLWVIWPLLSLNIFYDNNFGYVVTPIAEDYVKSAEAYETKNNPDLTKASNWYPNQPKSTTQSSVDTYYLTIPKLKIYKAVVKIGSDDLSKNLIHFGGSGLPGKSGKAVIFGHSILPNFYNPENYLAIFSLLPTLKADDDIFINFDGVDYRYRVVSKQITSPEDVSGLEQRYDNSYIILVTCYPPGTYWKRLWLTAKLTPYGS